jgi:signal transduction histidine kinase
MLSVHPAEARDRRLAGGTVIASTIVFLALVPFAKEPLTPVPAFISIVQSALVLNDLITAVLLYGLFATGRSRPILALATGYVFTAFAAIAHALTFPGLFQPGGLLGAGTQSTAWLYMFWHGGFPLFVIAYARLRGRDGVDWPMPLRPAIAVSASVGVAFLAACVVAAIATAGHDALPTLMVGKGYTGAYTVVVTAVWLLPVVALWMLWQLRPHSILDLWLVVVMCAWIFEIALSAGLNAGRFDVGFYTGRIFGLAAATFILVVLLLENGILYSRLANSYEEALAANRELDAFSYSVSHDLRAPVRAIKGFATILEEDHGGSLNVEGRRLLAAIREGSVRSGQLIEDLLDYARLGRQPLSTRRIELDTLVNQTIAELRESHGGRRIDFEVGDLGSAEADPTLLKQALANLLGNAVKFTRHKDPAVIEVGRRDALEPVFYVKDNGVGFDMRDANRLFGVFQRLDSARDYEGTGVGLAIVQKVIERHGGEVWAESKPGAGATFYFTL